MSVREPDSVIVGDYTISQWYGTGFYYCVAYAHDPWNLGLTYCHREFHF